MFVITENITKRHLFRYYIILSPELLILSAFLPVLSLSVPKFSHYLICLSSCIMYISTVFYLDQMNESHRLTSIPRLSRNAALLITSQFLLATSALCRLLMACSSSWCQHGEYEVLKTVSRTSWYLFPWPPWFVYADVP